MIPIAGADTTASDKKPLLWAGERIRAYGGDDLGTPTSIMMGAQPVLRQVIHCKQPSIADLLFNATAEAKIWTSRVAMKLDPAVRKRVFLQLDRLHDVEEWFDGDAPVDLESYKSFIRSVWLLPIASKPGLALTTEGRIIALWGKDGDRLSLEFLPDNRVRWVLSYLVDGTSDRNAGETSVLRLKSRLEPYNPEHWFDAA